MNKKISSLVLVITFLSVTLNVYLLFFISRNISTEQIIVDDNFIEVIQNIISKIENKNNTQLQKETYKAHLIEIIKKYPN